MAYDGTLKFDTAIYLKGFQKGINSIGSIAEKGLKATTAIFSGAVTTVSTLGIAAVKAGSDFEGAISRVEAISGAAGGDLEALTDKAKEMGASTKFSATESANAFEYMAMAGWKTNDMLNGIEGIMNLAAASGEDLASTSDIVTDALTAFGLSARDSTHFADVLAQASSNANTNVGMMGETFKYVAPVAGALGFSAEDTATAIGLMANAGIKGSQAGTALRSVMTRLAKPTKEVLGAMEDLGGLSLTDAQGNVKSLNQLMIDLRDGFSNLIDAEKAETAAALGGQEAMSGLLAIANASEEDFNKLTKSIYSCDGAAAEMAETMNDNLQGQLTILKSGLEGLGISLYENIQNPLKSIVSEAKNMVQQLQYAFDEGGFDGMVAAFGGILSQIAEKAAGAAPDLIEAASGLVSAFCSALKSSTGIGDAAASLITSLVTALFNCAGDLWTTAIALAGKAAQGIADGAPEIVRSVSGCVTDILGCLSEWAPSFADAGTRIVVSIAQGLADTLPVILQHGIDIILELGRGIAEAAPDLIPLAASCILDLLAVLTDPGNIDSAVDVGIEIIMAIADGIIQALPILIQRAPEIIINFWKALDRNLTKILKAGGQLVLKLAEGILSAIPELVRNLPKISEAILRTVQSFNLLEAGKSIILSIGEGMKSAGSFLLKAVASIDWASIAANMAAMASSAFDAVKDYLTGAALGLVTAAGECFSQLPEKVWNGIISAVEAVAEWGSQMQEALSHGAGRCIDLVILYFSGLPGKIWLWFAETVNKAAQWGASLKNTADTWVANTINSVDRFFSALPGRIWVWLVDTVSRVGQWGINLKNTAETWVTNTVNSVVSVFSQLPGKIWVWLLDIVNKTSQWGSSLLSTASTAASNTVNKVSEWFSQLPGKVWTWLSNTLSKATQFASDLKAKAAAAAQGFVTSLIDGVKGLPDKFKEIGSNIVTGIWSGISSGWNWLSDKVRSLANSLFETAKDALDINSPSKVFADEVGRFIPPGIGEGMEKSMPDLREQVDAEMKELVNRMKTAVAIETGGITVRTRAEAEHKASAEYRMGGGDTYVDQHIEQENNYHVPVATPSETSKAQREAARKLLGGVK